MRFIIPFLFLLLFPFCGRKGSEGKGSEVEKKPAIKVDDLYFTADDIKKAIDSLSPIRQRELYSNPQKMTEAIVELIMDMAILKYAKDKGYFDRPDIKARYIQFLSQFIQPYIWSEEIRPYTKIDFSELQKYYEENKEKYKRKETRRVMQMEFKTQKEAEDMKKKIKRIEDFPEYAKKIYNNLNFDLGYVDRNRLPPLPEVVFSAKKGEIVGPVKVGDEYVIYAILDILPEGYWEFERIVERVYKDVRVEKIRRRLEEIQKEFFTKYNVFIDDVELKEKLGVEVSKTFFERYFFQSFEKKVSP